MSGVLFKDRSLGSSLCPHGIGELTHYDSMTLNAASDCSQQRPQKGPSPTCGSEALGQPARTPQTQARPRKPQSDYPCSRHQALLGRDQPRDPSSTKTHAQRDSRQLAFIWGKMRTSAREKASQTALGSFSEEAEARSGYM